MRSSPVVSRLPVTSSSGPITETTLVAGLPALAEDPAEKAESGFLVKIKVGHPKSAFAGDPRPITRLHATGAAPSSCPGHIVLTAR
jgi:hypothetical protein